MRIGLMILFASGSPAITNRCDVVILRSRSLPVCLLMIMSLLAAIGYSWLTARARPAHRPAVRLPGREIGPSTADDSRRLDLDLPARGDVETSGSGEGGEQQQPARQACFASRSYHTHDHLATAFLRSLLSLSRILLPTASTTIIERSPFPPHLLPHSPTPLAGPRWLPNRASPSPLSASSPSWTSSSPVP